VEANRFLTYTLQLDVPHPSELVLFVNGVAIFYTVVAASHFVVKFTLKAAEFSLSALQPCQHFYNF
jgi:hypothetical protein